MAGRGAGIAAGTLLLSATMALWAADASDGEEELRLARVRAKVSGYLRRMPNYTCVQTIERSRRINLKTKFKAEDKLRLEVALVDGRELFAWPGSGSFEDRSIQEMVPDGAIGTGVFASFAKAVFQTNAARFSYAGERFVEPGARRMYRWDFDVPILTSGYVIRVGSVEGRVAYRGSFWVDAGTLELERFDVEAYDIPSHLGLAESQQTILYQLAPLGEEKFLLPKSAELTMVQYGGGASRNVTNFAGCRQYTGESVLRFDDPDPATGELPALVTLDAPAGLTLEMHLREPLRLLQAAKGDPVFATLRKDAKQNGQAVIPKGAAMRGRVTALRRFEGSPPFYAVGLSFTEASLGNKTWRLKSRLVAVLAAPQLAMGAPPRMRYGAELPQAGNLVFVQGYKMELPPGFQMIWETVAASEPGETK